MKFSFEELVFLKNIWREDTNLAKIMHFLSDVLVCQQRRKEYVYMFENWSFLIYDCRE
mgnify:FL=1